MAAYLVGKAVVGAPGDIHLTARNIVGTECDGYDAAGKPARYIYLLGVANTVDGFAVTFDEAGVTTALAANAKGPVAWATGATVASTWGWYMRKSFGGATLVAAASSADNGTLGRETTDGNVGDGRVAGDQIIGAISRGASGSGVQLVQVMDGPFVDDFQGA